MAKTAKRKPVVTPKVAPAEAMPSSPIDSSADDILANPDVLIATILKHLMDVHDSDYYVYAGPLEREFENKALLVVQRQQEKRKNAVLFLETYGGHADAAYKIAKAFKRNYEKFTVMVTSDCKSAGTLLCLGADGLVMSDQAELGPLDVQIPKEGEFSGRRSGLDITDTLGALSSESIRLMRAHFIDLRLGSGQQISTRDALENATKIVCGLLAPVYAQINPMNLGESARSNSIAFHYGQRLSKGNLHPGALEKLISGYPSHGFVIDREEATELFSMVREPSPQETVLMMLLVQKHEQLASRRRPLILSMSEAYSDQLHTQEMDRNEPESSNRKANDGQPGNVSRPADVQSESEGPNGGGIDGHSDGNAQPDAVNAGASDGDAVPSRAAKPGNRVRKITPNKDGVD